MAITKIDANSFDLTDDYAFTGTITGDTGGSYELLNTVNVTSATANVEFDNTYITSSYTDYKVMFSRVKPSTDQVKFEMHIQKVGESSYLTGNHQWVFNGRDASNALREAADVNSTEFRLVGTNLGNAAGETVSGEIVLIDPLKNHIHQLKALLIMEYFKELKIQEMQQLHILLVNMQMKIILL